MERWTVQQRFDALRALDAFAHKRWISGDRLQLPEPLKDIIVQNLQEAIGDTSQAFEGVLFFSLRVLIHSSHDFLMAHREAWIDRCLALLLYPSGSVADSANWLLQGFGRQGAIALFNRAQRESPDNKALYLAWLSKNGHISHSPAFENEVYEAWLIGLASSDKKLKKHCLIALLDNSPWRAEPVRSFETSQDYNILLPRLVAVLEEFEADTEEEYRKLAAFYKEVLAL